MPLDLAWLAFTLRSRWRWLAASAALGLAAAMLLSSAERPTWQAEALVAPEVEMDPTDPLARQSALHAGARFLTLPSMGRAVQRALGGSVSLESVHARLESEIDREAGVIRVRARGETADAARRLATVAVTAFMDQRRAVESDRLSSVAARLSAESGAARARLDRARASYDAFRAAHGIDDLASDRTRAIDEAARWLAADGTIAWALLPSFDFETDCELAADTVRCERVLSATCHLTAVCAVSICQEWCRL
jgi:uncharacterized protein involved in exopolysaccharide biosynthesis